MDEKRAKIMLIVAMSLFGTVGIFVKQVDLPPQEIVFYRVTFGLIALLLFFAVTRRRFDFSFLNKSDDAGTPYDPVKNRIFILIGGISLAGGWLFLFNSYNYTTVAIGTLVNYIEPCIIMVAGVIIFREKVTKLRVLFFSLSTLGLVLVVLGGGSGGVSPNIFLGVASGLTSAVFYAANVIAIKQVKGGGGFETTIGQLAVAFVVLLIYNSFTCGIDITGLPAKQIICLVIIGMFHTGIVYSAYITSLPYVKAQEIAVVSYLDPFFSVLSSAFILSEPINLTEWIGAAMVIGFMVLGELKGGSPENEQDN